jgi:hypothetical protein
VFVSAVDPPVELLPVGEWRGNGVNELDDLAHTGGGVHIQGHSARLAVQHPHLTAAHTAAAQEAESA